MRSHRKLATGIVLALLLCLIMPTLEQSFMAAAAHARRGLPAQARSLCADNYTSEKCTAHAREMADQLSRYPIPRLERSLLAVAVTYELGSCLVPRPQQTLGR